MYIFDILKYCIFNICIHIAHLCIFVVCLNHLLIGKMPICGLIISSFSFSELDLGMVVIFGIDLVDQLSSVSYCNL